MGWADMPLTIQRKQAACMIEVRMMAYRGKEIQNLTVIRSGVTNAIRRNDWKLQGACNPNRSLIPPLLLAFAMALQFDVNILGTEDANQLLYCFAACLLTTTYQRRSERSFIPTR